jgi:hypothetical protein
MSDSPSPIRSRRSFLQLATVAPLAALGCATLRPVAAGPTRAGPAAAGPDPLAAVRAVPLPTSVEPALIFRALGGRGRCG